MKQQQLSFFFPCHNEEKNIGQLLKTTTEFAKKFLTDYEILVIDDGSTDQTRKIAEDYALIDPKVRVVHHPISQKYGGALKSGFMNARLPYIFYTDGDAQFKIEELESALAFINEKTVISGFRKKRHDPLLRLIYGAVFNLCVRIAFNLHVRDIDSAFKVYPKWTVDKMNFYSKGAMIDTEMLVKAKNLNCKIYQFPVTHLPRKFGHASGANLSVILLAMKEFLGLRLHLFSWIRNK